MELQVRRVPSESGAKSELSTGEELLEKLKSALQWSSSGLCAWQDQDDLRDPSVADMVFKYVALSLTLQAKTGPLPQDPCADSLW